ncbi:MAG: hypothetical protein QXU32_12545 [Nitrososphaerales archaeon]
MSTTIQIKKKSQKMLDILKKSMNAKSYDEVIEKLISQSLDLEDLFGADKGRISKFKEEDRLE